MIEIIVFGSRQRAVVKGKRTLSLFDAARARIQVFPP
jgi:hypothetical protein